MTRFQTTYNRYFGKDRIESIQKAGLREAFYYHYDSGIASDEEEDDVSHITIIRALILFIKTSLDPVEEHDQRHMIYFG